jgi:hypothetical protein
VTKRLTLQLSERLEKELEHLCASFPPTKSDILRAQLRMQSDKRRVDQSISYRLSDYSLYDLNTLEALKYTETQIAKFEEITILNRVRAIEALDLAEKLYGLSIEKIDEPTCQASPSSEIPASAHESAFSPIELSQEDKSINVSFKMSNRADTLLLFVCPTPDDAEASVGDLMERFEQVRARKSWRISVAYFYWELLLLTVTKAKTRMIGATIGPLLKRFFAG